MAAEALPGPTAAAALDVVHPAHFAGIPRGLCERALRSRCGRRRLAGMAHRIAPDVFAPGGVDWNAWLPTHPWLRWSRPQIEWATRLLGVFALAPALRVTLERKRVLLLRAAVGADAWRAMQAFDPWKGTPPEAVRHMGAARLRRCGDDEAAIRDATMERGIIEFVGHVERADATLAQRLRLAYARDIPPACSPERWLPDGAAEEALAGCVEAGIDGDGT